MKFTYYFKCAIVNHEPTISPSDFPLFQEEGYIRPTRGTISRRRKDTCILGSSLVDTGEFAVPVCEAVSDWPLQTRNIILHVSASPIGYRGPALHQAVALDGNIININIRKFKTSAGFSSGFLLLYCWLNYIILCVVQKEERGDWFSLVRAKGVDRLDMGSAQNYYWLLRNLVGLREINNVA